MEKQTDKESISKRDIILNESFRLFLKKGYAAVSFSDLVEATGISRGNMFHHFKNKEDIFNHAVDRFVFEFLTNDIENNLERMGGDEIDHIRNIEFKGTIFPNYL